MCIVRIRKFYPLKFFELHFLKTENFKAKIYMLILRSNLPVFHFLKFHSVIHKFDEVMLYYVRSPREFSIFTMHLPQNRNF